MGRVKDAKVNSSDDVTCEVFLQCKVPLRAIFTQAYSRLKDTTRARLKMRCGSTDARAMERRG